MIILVCSVLGFSTLGCILAVLACLCFASKKKTGENNNDLSVASLNNSNSYIHYNSPRFGAGAKHNKRRTSASSGLTQSTASFRSLMINKVRERIDEDCLELCKKPEQSEKVPPAPAPVVEVETIKPSETKVTEVASNNCNVTEVGDTTRDTTNATLKSLHGTTTSLCEQCLTPASPTPQPATSTTGGQSDSVYCTDHKSN